MIGFLGRGAALLIRLGGYIAFRTEEGAEGIKSEGAGDVRGGVESHPASGGLRGVIYAGEKR